MTYLTCSTYTWYYSRHSTHSTMLSLSFLSQNSLWPLIVSTLALVIVKATLVAIFPDASPDEHLVELHSEFLRPFGKSLFYDIYDTVFGLLMFAIFSFILSIPWSKWTSDDFCYSRFTVVHVMLGILAYTAIMIAPYTDTYFRETATDDWFVLVKKPSLIVGWIAILAVELLGTSPSHWTSHFTALVLSLNVFEAAFLGFVKEGQYISGLVLIFIVPFSPMIYVDRQQKILTSTTDYEQHPAFWAYCYKKNPLPTKWYYRLYCLALLSMGMLNDYFAKYGLMVPLTLCIPLLVTEVKAFHSEPECRFEKYTEIFFLLRVTPLWFNTIYGLAFREVWLSYFDSSFQGHFTFVIENVYVRNGIDFVFLVVSILFLIHRDRQEEYVLKGDEESSENQIEELP